MTGEDIEKTISSLVNMDSNLLDRQKSIEYFLVNQTSIEINLIGRLQSHETLSMF